MDSVMGKMSPQVRSWFAHKEAEAQGREDLPVGRPELPGRGWQTSSRHVRSLGYLDELEKAFYDASDMSTMLPAMSKARLCEGSVNLPQIR